MPVYSKHKEYEKLSPKWFKYRTIISGEDDVKDAGVIFLPMLEGHSPIGFNDGSKAGSYEGYKDRASFFAATSRIADGILGAVFRKDPIIEFPESRKDFLDTIGKEDTPFNIVSKNTFKNVLDVGKHGILLDMPETAGPTDAPYFSDYNTESIWNWRTEKINGKDKLVLVVLEENKDTFIDDPFVPTTTEFLRVLKLGIFKEENGDISDTPFYFVELWEKMKGKNKKDEYQMVKTIIPTIRGKRLDYIPFVIFKVQKPPLADIVAINISHYRSSADLEHGRHFTALPTAWIAGFDVTSEFKIGSTTAWVSEDPKANAGFLEFTGQGLKAIETALNDKEAQMAVLGARLLEEPKKSVESAETHIVRKSGEESITASLSRTVSLGFTQLLKWSAEWMGLVDSDVSCELNRDYSSVEISPQMLQALMLLLASGRMSMDTFHYNLKRGELYPEGRTLEQELDLIDQNPSVPGIDEMDLDKDDDKDNDKDNDKDKKDDEK